MNIVMLLTVIIISTVLCLIEIPKMKKENQIKEIWTFSLLLALFTVLAILKCLGIDIPNPSDFIAWIYSPITGVTKALMQ